MFPGEEFKWKREFLTNYHANLIFWVTNLIVRVLDIQIFRPEVLDPYTLDPKILIVWLIKLLSY